ncbi:hypothetical protein CXP35_07060 [Komagataeibacter xylinus]|nr:hypothetical protein CXP35_07060 [Komagataeibacter xylinus]
MARQPIRHYEHGEVIFGESLYKIKKFLVKPFSKSFKKRRLFEKRRHPKTFYFSCSDPACGGRSGGTKHTAMPLTACIRSARAAGGSIVLPRKVRRHDYRASSRQFAFAAHPVAA